MDENNSQFQERNKQEKPRLSRNIWGHSRQIFRKYLGMPSLTETRKTIVLNDLIDASSPEIDFFILVFFAAGIATFGLIADSSVVTIGAQLVDPLMSPILGFSIASLTGLKRMYKRAIIAVVKGILLAIILSAAISFLTYRLPLGEAAAIPHEVLVRTTATPLDLGIALIGGAAAAYALAHPRLDAALPGVAIATALMPPLCTIGYGIAFMSGGIILGAALQFFTNFSAISFAAIATFALLGFGPKKTKQPRGLSRSITVTAVMLLAIGIPLVILAWSTMKADRLNTRANQVITQNLPPTAEAQLTDLDITTVSGETEITATIRAVRPLNTQETTAIKQSLTEHLEQAIILRVVTLPMQVLDP